LSASTRFGLNAIAIFMSYFPKASDEKPSASADIAAANAEFNSFPYPASDSRGDLNGSGGSNASIER